MRSDIKSGQEGQNPPRIALPVEFETALKTQLKRRFLKGRAADTPWNPRDTVFFSTGVERLNSLFTTEARLRRRDYFSDAVLRSGYLAYFLPINALKAAAILLRHGALNEVTRTAGEGGVLRVIDVGAGPLTMVFGLIFALLQIRRPPAALTLEVEVFERSEKILADGQAVLTEFLARLLPEARLRVRLKRYAGDVLRHHFEKRADLILMGNVLNEFDERALQQHFVLRLLRHAAISGGQVFCLEPSSKKISRDLQALRDVVIAAAGVSVMGPCLHNKTCPFNLTAKSDWCHFYQDWQTPGFLCEMDRLTGLKKNHLAYSYLLFRVGPAAPLVHGPREFIAISNPLRAGRAVEIIGCGSSGRVRVRREERDKGPLNRAFGDLRRGSLFALPGMRDTQGYELERHYRIGPKDIITLVRANPV